MGKKMLTKMKAVTVTKQNVLVNANNFLCMQQQKAEIVRLYLGRLKGTAKHCNFTLPMGKTSCMDKMVMNTVVQGLEDTAIAKDVIESYATNNTLQTCLNLKKLKSSSRPKRAPKETCLNSPEAKRSRMGPQTS